MPTEQQHELTWTAISNVRYSAFVAYLGAEPYGVVEASSTGMFATTTVTGTDCGDFSNSDHARQALALNAALHTIADRDPLITEVFMTDRDRPSADELPDGSNSDGSQSHEGEDTASGGPADSTPE